MDMPEILAGAKSTFNVLLVRLKSPEKLKSTLSATIVVPDFTLKSVPGATEMIWAFVLMLKKQTKV
jgi:hypothetical protein